MEHARINLSDVLTLTDVEARTSNYIFTGRSITTPHGRAFGGQVLAQAIMAAGATVEDAREIHSMHCYFLRPGKADQPMTFEVAQLHDARSFSSRRTEVFQNGELLMSLFASFQTSQGGMEHQERFDISSVPTPESLPSMWDLYSDAPQDPRLDWLLARPFDIRYTSSDIVMQNTDARPNQMVWMRATETLVGGSLIHRAALAFGSDYTLVETVLRAHGIAWSNPNLRAASLDHAMWFHRPFRADEWLLYVQETPTSQGGRGLTDGRFYNQVGEHVASVSQEAMVRLLAR